jgi:hypothetical protein
LTWKKRGTQQSRWHCSSLFPAQTLPPSAPLTSNQLQTKNHRNTFDLKLLHLNLFSPYSLSNVIKMTMPYQMKCHNQTSLKFINFGKRGLKGYIASILGSTDFGTLTYFKLIWIAGKILRSNYKIRFALFLATSCENGVFWSWKIKEYIHTYIYIQYMYKGRQHFSWNRSISVSKDPYFYADFKNVDLP